jgi:eukaryotic-like serine/threonine-protein kinase
LAIDTNLAGEDRIGGFRFVRTIHPGATSVVMEVVQDSTGKRFALKQLNPSRAEDPSERKLFEFEAKLGMEFRHPNLVRVHEYFKDPTGPYFIMDLFPSYHMKLPIARPSVYPMPVTQLHRIMEQTAQALSYMHDKGWVHRDVKPENVLVSKAGEVRLIDYALALRPFTGLKKLFKKKGPVQGTPSYMSPEQIRGIPPQPSADIYSFGITCYELACGRPPFRANSQTELLNKHLSDKPLPLTALNKEVTSEFSDLILKLIAKKPSDRLSSLREFSSKFTRTRIYKNDPDPMGGSS